MSIDIDLSNQVQILRQELKQWEQQFAASHGGAKATREEIKRDALIAGKYKEYNRVRELLSGNAPSKPVSPVKVKARPSRTKSDGGQHDRTATLPTVAADLNGVHLRTPQRRRSKHAIQHTTPQQKSKTLNTHIYLDEQIENVRPMPAFIGPTPQKDGRVLGLFDLLSPVAQRVQTPSKSRTRNAMSEDSDGQNRGGKVVTGTPKTDKYYASVFATTHDGVESIEAEGQRQRNGGETPGTKHRHSRTPQSIGKRFLLDSFVTPSKRRRLSDTTTVTPIVADDATVPVVDHPGLDLATPAFLRRHDSMNLSSVAEVVEPSEGDAGADPGKIQSPSRRPTWLRRRSGPGSFERGRIPGVVRGLSSMIADMKKAEDDRLDEEMELLRDMEDGNNEEVVERRLVPAVTTSSNMLLVEDSQQVDVADLKLLGPDGSHALNDDDSDADGRKVELGRDGKPLRIWKKKGLKRQTKRVNMRPVTRPKPLVQQSNPADLGSNDEDDDTGVNKVVSETQPLYSQAAPDEDQDEEHAEHQFDDHGDSGSGNDFKASQSDTSDFEDDSQSKTQKRHSHAQGVKATTLREKTNPGPTAISTKPAALAQAPQPANEGVVKRAVRKISATAHANFRRLKIKSSKGAKAGGGGGRFGGRRFGRR